MTVQNIAPIMEAVGDWRKLASDPHYCIPGAIQERITQHHATNKDQSCAAGEWWVYTHLFPSWDHLANALYRSGENKALEKMAQYLPKGVYKEGILYTVVFIVSVSSATSCFLLH